MKDRLIIFLEYLGIGQNKFAQNVGLSAGYVNNLGENISSRSLNKILNVYPQLNEKWLLTGKGVYSPKLNSKISFMPSFAKHGYSKGIAYSDKDKIVIYWLIFW